MVAALLAVLTEQNDILSLKGEEKKKGNRCAVRQ